MSAYMINIDSDVFAELQRLATPLVDDANSVLRRILGLSDVGDEPYEESATADVEQHGPAPPSNTSDSPIHTKARQQGHTSSTAPVEFERFTIVAPRGSRLPQSEYELPILEAIIELGGGAPSSRVVELVGKKLADKLTSVDFTRVKSGETRWENRTRFARLMLKNLGQISPDSPHGTWEITDEGRSRVASETGRSG